MNAFHVLGGLLGVWAVVLTALGLTRAGFPRGRAERLVIATSILLVSGAIGAAVITAAEEEEEEGEHAPETKEPGGAAGGLALTADPGGQLEFDKSSLEAKAGKVTITMKNPASLQHDVSIDGRGVDERGNVVGKDGTSTVTAELEAGRYTFYCSVSGHRQGGMEGTLTVQ